VDEYGSSTAVDGGRVPRGMEATAELAIDNCPEFAITVIEK
jgi:ferredoxin